MPAVAINALPQTNATVIADLMRGVRTIEA